jgi:NCAIR mutase (PurE)-related protein
MDSQQLDTILRQVATGKLNISDAAKALSTLETSDLGFARIDHQRDIRCGFSEVVFGAGKQPDHITAIVRDFVDRESNVLVTRLDEHIGTTLAAEFAGTWHATPRILTVFHHQPDPRPGKILVLSGGTSDAPVADEAVETMRFFGFSPTVIHDVGVAGLHRLLAHLDELTNSDVIIAIAGMEGALPSVVGGLVRAPVIAVPTSVGYGASYDGIAALLAMLNSCASGVTVTNIDNGFGAACSAMRIMNVMGDWGNG